MIIALNSGAVEATATNWAYVPSGNENETTIKYSTTTQNLTTSAKTGAITLAEGATKQVDTSISAGSTSTKLPTSAAVASFVEGKNYATNSFSNIAVGSTTIAADSKADTLTIAAGSNVTITPDADNDKITISSTNTDTKVTNTLATTTKAYVTGTTTATTNTGTQVFDTGVYLDTTAGMLTATTFKGSLSGNANTATSFASNQSVALTGQVTGSASSKGGWSLATTVNQCSTDALFNGTNTLILNCGSATA